MLYILLRLLVNIYGKHLCTFQTISDFFELNNRQDSNNFFREFQQSDKDMATFLIRKRKFRATIPIIETQILSNIELTIKQQYQIFCENHPEFNMSCATFKKIVGETDALKMYHKFKNLSKANQEDTLNTDPEIDNVSSKSIHGNISKEAKRGDDKRKLYNLSRNTPFFHKALLALLFLACGVNMEVIGMIFGVAKSTINNWLYKLPDMKRMILNSIRFWSGVVCVDEKWVKINGQWHYVLSFVDNLTGFPLHMKTVYDLKKETWAVFMKEFRKLYGNPRLIISDGSKSLAAARNSVFPKTPYQLCWFHKLKNLNDRIYKVHDIKIRSKLLIMSNNMFHNSSASSRKRTAKRIVAMNVPGVSDYVLKNILGDWKHLNQMMTSNAVERWNRKIEKVISGRYGLKSVNFVEKLLDGLWLKEILFDQRHLSQGFFTELNVYSICQENLKPAQIVRFLKDKLFKQVA